MDRRSKILAAVFGAAMLYGVVAKTVYPTYIKPLLTYGERIAAKQLVLDKLIVTEDEVDKARFDYKAFVQRTGSFDMAAVENEIRQRLYTLIELHELKDWTVSPGSKSEDRKTKVKSMLLTVQAQGPVQGVAGLMRDVTELPYLVRFGNVSVSPSKSTLSGGRMTLYEHVSFRLPIEIKVLPQHQMAGRIDPETLPEPEPIRRHQGRDYAALWSGRPFSEFMKPRPLKADAGKDQNLSKTGRTIALRGSATGGVGEYVYQWSPSEGLDNPERQATKVDTSKPGEFEYTLTVTDEAGERHSDTVIVKIAEPRKVATKPKAPPPSAPKVPKGPQRWAERRFMQIVMSLGRTYRGERRDELMIFERKNKQTSYYSAGDEFDGGELVYVHQTGGLVRRKDGYFVYPIGAPLDKDLSLEKADAFPELRRAADVDRELLEKASAAKVDAAEPEQGETTSATKPSEGSPGGSDAKAFVDDMPPKPVTAQPVGNASPTSGATKKSRVKKPGKTGVRPRGVREAPRPVGATKKKGRAASTRRPKSIGGGPK